MASEGETVMAVCAEWRDCIESADPSLWNDERIAGLVKTTRAQQITYLDRIEAAAKWEKAEVAADALAVGGIVVAERHTPGNAAAMRATLVDVKKSIDDIGASSLNCDPEVIMMSLTQVCARLSAMIERALSAPARNCDKFTDAESARQAWLDDAENWDEFGSPKLELHEWLFALAAERKGEGDGR